MQVSVLNSTGVYEDTPYISRSSANTFFKFLAFATAVFVQLLKVLHSLLGSLKSGFLAFLCL